MYVYNIIDMKAEVGEEGKREKKGSSSLIIVVGEAKAGQVKSSQARLGWVGSCVTGGDLATGQ